MLTPAYTVTFDKNGGNTEAIPTTKTTIHGGNVGTLPEAPTKTGGYTFASWNTQKQMAAEPNLQKYSSNR